MAMLDERFEEGRKGSRVETNELSRGRSCLPGSIRFELPIPKPGSARPGQTSVWAGIVLATTLHLPLDGDSSQGISYHKARQDCPERGQLVGCRESKCFTLFSYHPSSPQQSMSSLVGKDENTTISIDYSL